MTKWEDLEADAMYAMGNINGELGDFKGTMEEMVETQEETFGQRFQSMIRELKDALLPLGTVLLQLAEDWLPKIASTLQNASAWFGNLSPPIQQLIVILGAIGAAIGPVLVIIGTLVSSIGALIPVIAGISAPIALTIAGIVAFGVALVALYQKSETFRTTLTNVFTKIQEVALMVFGVVSSFIQEKLGAIKTFWDQHGSQFLQAVQNVFNGIKAVIDFVMPAILFIVEMVWTAIKNVIDGALNIILGLVKVFTGIFTADFGLLWEGVKQIFFGAIDFIIGLMTLSFVGGIRTLLTNLVKLGVNLVKNLSTGIVNLFRSFTSTGSKLAEGMVNGVINFFKNLYTQASNIFNMLRTFGASVWNAISQTILGVARNIWTGVKTNFQNMLNSIKSIFGTVKTTISNIWNGVMDFFRGINLKQIGKDIIQGLINGIGSMGSAVWNKAKEIATGIGDSIKKALKINSPSKVTMEFGEFTGEGLAIGIEKMKKAVANASATLADYAVPSTIQQPSLQISEQTLQNSLQMALPEQQPIHITLVTELDGQEVARNQFPYLNGMMSNASTISNIFKGVKR